MKLKFNKKNYTCHWFDDNEFDDDYTEKVPPHTGVIFDDNTNEWILKEPDEPEGE